MSEFRWIRLVLGLCAAFVVAGGLVLALFPLPVPAAGGTCGPGTSSEAAIVAFFEPGSIGAGAKPPPSQAAARQQWQAFVDECQSATTTRMTTAFVFVALAAFLAFVAPLVVRRILQRIVRRGQAQLTGARGYPDPDHPLGWR